MAVLSSELVMYDRNFCSSPCKQEMKDVFRCLADAPERRANEVMRGRRLVDRHNNLYLVFDGNTI